MEVGGPLIRSSLSCPASHPPQSLPGVLKGMQGSMPRAETSASLASCHLPAVLPWGGQGGGVRDPEAQG